MLTATRGYWDSGSGVGEGVAYSFAVTLVEIVNGNGRNRIMFRLGE